MKKVILTFIFTIFATISFAQLPQIPMERFRGIDLNKYSVVDSLPLDRVMIYFDREIDDETFISQGGGYYMAPLPHHDRMIIRKTEDNTKAIVIYNSYIFGRHYEFNVEDNEHRTVLWYKDKNVYCGYIYDKKFKVCKYFDSKKEYRRFFKRRKF